MTMRIQCYVNMKWMQAQTGAFDLLDDLRLHAVATPDKAAILAPGQASLSYGRMWSHMEATAAALAGTGVTRSDTVAAVLPAGPEFLCAFAAVTAAAAFAP